MICEPGMEKSTSCWQHNVERLALFSFRISYSSKDGICFVCHYSADRHLRSTDFTRRRRFVQLVEDVRKFGAEVVIFSSMHESGERKSSDITHLQLIIRCCACRIESLDRNCGSFDLSSGCRDCHGRGQDWQGCRFGQ